MRTKLHKKKPHLDEFGVIDVGVRYDGAWFK